MNELPISMEEFQDILLQEQNEYDIARIVNPYACGTMRIDENGISAEGTCYHIWKHDHRCSNCFSRRAIIQRRILYKTEVMEGKSYRIKTSPYRVIMQDGEERNYVIESVQISDLEEEKVNTSLQADLKRSPTDYVFNEALTGVIHMDSEFNIIFANKHAKAMILRGGENEEFMLRSVVTNWLEGLQDSSLGSEWHEGLRGPRTDQQENLRTARSDAAEDSQTGYSDSRSIAGDQTEHEQSDNWPHLIPLVFTQRYEYDHKDYFFNVQLIPFENELRRELFIILQEHTEEEAERLAVSRDIDPMTGLYNESGFHVAMERILDLHPERKYTHIRLNVKNFSLVKSVFGVQTGDALKIRLGWLFKRMAEETGCACHFHSDQFGLLIETEYLDLTKLDLDLIEIKKDADNHNFGLQFQAGIYNIEDNALEAEVICDRASMAMRYAKDCGDSMSCAVYTEEMTLAALSDNRLMSQFEQALRNDEFHMFLQPQTDAEGNVRSAEALARWIQNGEVIAPAHFIPGLEKNGMIYRMDRVIWEKAARQLHDWKGTAFSQIAISVNVSPIDVTIIDIVAYFEKLVEKYQIDPGMLNIEITESAMINSPEQLLRIVDRLHRRGFCVEIDDFGSGYSSLKMLKDLNADVLKIDQGFLEHTVHERKMKTILSAIISLSHALGMKVITEGVETKEMVDMLSEMGCHLFQGYYFARPMPVNEFVKKYQPRPG